jgi:hypothetical protein
MIIGYEISGYDNNSYMTGNWNGFLPEIQTIIPHCHECGYRVDYRFTNPYFKLRRKTLDFSSTYDGVDIVSLKFKEFCIRNEYKNLKFTKLPLVPNFFQFSVEENTLKYNFSFRENLCEKCGQYESVVGPSLNIDDINEILKDGFYKSDLWFASGNEKSPVIVIAPSTKKKLEKENFKNLCLKQIEK